MPTLNESEQGIVKSILDTKDAIELQIGEKKRNLFLTFWDFDGTILKGDCSEGLQEPDGFKGLMELGIQKGFLSEFKGEGGVKSFWKKYREMEEVDKREAYIFLPRLFAGNKEETILNMAREHFTNVMRNFYFPSSLNILEALNANGIKSYILSASANLFLKGSESTIPIEVENMNGIEVVIKDGIITQEEIEPVTYAEGKTEKLKQIVNNLLQQKKADQVFVLAGFGNNFHTDGPFLQFIAEQRLIAGNPTTVMINGGIAPAKYKDLFKEVEFELIPSYSGRMSGK